MFIKLANGVMINTEHVVWILDDKVHLSNGAMCVLQADELARIEEVVGVYAPPVNAQELLLQAKLQRLSDESADGKSRDMSIPTQAKRRQGRGNNSSKGE